MALTSEELGLRIADARKAVGMTQEDLAIQLGIDRSAMAKIEKGARRVDSLELVAITEALDVSLDSLLRQDQPLVVRLRNADQVSSATRKQVDWVQNFMSDYSFLKQLTNE